jgi:hypothetical protein
MRQAVKTVNAFTAAAMLLFLTLAGPLKAGVITVEPDDFLPGTNISTSGQGVVIREATDAAVVLGDVEAQTIPAASTGSQGFGRIGAAESWFFGSLGGSVNPPGRAFLALFDEFTDFVALDFINNDTSDVGILRAYDGAGSLLTTLTTSVLTGAGAFETLTLTRATADVAYILAAGSDSRNDDIDLDNLRFNAPSASIPGPPTFALLLLGFAAIRIQALRLNQI